MKKTLLYTLLFLFSLALFLVLLMPASVLWEKGIEPQVSLANTGVVVKGLEGTVFDGRALLEVERVPMLLSWDLDAGALLSGQIALPMTLETYAGQLDARVIAGLSSVQVLIDGAELELAQLNQVSRIKRHRIKLDGQILAKDLRFTVSDQQLVLASGAFSWSGGDIAYPVGRQLHERAMPSFRGDIATREDGLIQLTITDPDASFAVIEGSLLPEGLAQLQVRRRLLDLADEPWSRNSTEQDVVFKVKKSIY